MPSRLTSMFKIPNTKDQIIAIGKNHGLNSYEIELLLRIYWKKQSLNYISFNMDFAKYGKPQKYYSVRSLNNFHKEAIMKIVMNEKKNN